MSKKKQVYLDYAAATPLDPSAKKAMEPYLNDKFYNPSAIYSPAKDVKSDIDIFRQDIAKTLGIKKSELIFTAGATEANNLAVFGATADYPDGHIVTTAIEHDSILKPVEYLAGKGRSITVVKPDAKGIVDVEDVVSAIKENTVFISIILANNEIGTIQPVSKIAARLDGLRKQRQRAGSKLPLILHTDAAQAVNYLNVHPKRLGVDLMSFNGSKIYGPKQIGALYTDSHIKLRPVIFGGGQEKGLRSGTENPAYIAGFTAALKKASAIRKIESERLSKLQEYFIESLLANFKQASINGSLKKRLPNNVHATFDGIDNERLLYELDEQGIYAASGSACSESSEESSRVLSAIGLSETEARSSVRFSLGRQTSKDDISYVIERLKRIVN